jgi:hypothetical protein
LYCTATEFQVFRLCMWCNEQRQVSTKRMGTYESYVGKYDILIYKDNLGPFLMPHMCNCPSPWGRSLPSLCSQTLLPSSPSRQHLPPTDKLSLLWTLDVVDYFTKHTPTFFTEGLGFILFHVLILHYLFSRYETKTIFKVLSQLLSMLWLLSSPSSSHFFNCSIKGCLSWFC